MRAALFPPPGFHSQTWSSGLPALIGLGGSGRRRCFALGVGVRASPRSPAQSLVPDSANRCYLTSTHPAEPCLVGSCRVVSRGTPGWCLFCLPPLHAPGAGKVPVARSPDPGGDPSCLPGPEPPPSAWCDQCTDPRPCTCSPCPTGAGSVLKVACLLVCLLPTPDDVCRGSRRERCLLGAGVGSALALLAVSEAWASPAPSSRVQPGLK